MAAFYSRGEWRDRREVRMTGPFGTYEEAVAENERMASLVRTGDRRERQTVVVDVGSFASAKHRNANRFSGRFRPWRRRSLDE